MDHFPTQYSSAGTQRRNNVDSKLILRLDVESTLDRRYFNVVYLLGAYHIYYMYSDKQAWANSEEPDQTRHIAASDLGLHCFLLIILFYTKEQEVQ